MNSELFPPALLAQLDKIGQLFVWRCFGNTNVQYGGNVNRLRLGSMEVRKLGELLQPAHRDALWTIAQSIETTRGNLHHALGWNAQQARLIQIGASPSHSIVDHRLMTRR